MYPSRSVGLKRVRAKGAAMVDVELRRKLAFDLRQYALGRLNGLDFIRRWTRLERETPDPAVRAIVSFVLMSEDPMTGDLASRLRRGKRERPSRGVREFRRRLARVLIFLYTDLPYEWHDALPRFEHGLTPTKFGLGLVAAVECVLGSWLFVTLGAAKIIFGFVSYLRRLRQYNQKPEVRELIARREAFWPFMREEDLVEALSRPRLLAGAA